MKHNFALRCDYCGAPFTLRMHKAEFARCTGKAVCEKQDCRDKSAAETLAKVQSMKFQTVTEAYSL